MKYILSLLLLSFVWVSCNQQPGSNAVQTEPARPKSTVKIPDFNSDSAYESVRIQLAFGPRVPNTPAHDKCAAYLISKMKSYTPVVMVQKGTLPAFNGTPLHFQNIIASWKPETSNRILLCAHWDSRPFADHDPDKKNRSKPVDAANDGASGVGVLMEMARQFSLSNPAVGVDIIFFDVEDYGPPQDLTVDDSEDQWGLGAQYWAKNPHKSGYAARYGILLDMVGARNATFLMEGYSMQYAGDIVKSVWSTAARIGYVSWFPEEQAGYITDDHVPLNRIANIPTIDIIHLDKNSETGFYPYLHTTGDTFDKIDKNTLKVVGQTLLTVVYEER